MRKSRPLSAGQVYLLRYFVTAPNGMVATTNAVPWVVEHDGRQYDKPNSACEMTQVRGLERRGLVRVTRNGLVAITDEGRVAIAKARP